MPQRPETREVARAVRDHVRRGVGVHGQKLVKGLVRNLSPLQVELTSNDLILEEDSLLLGAWPRYFDKLFGIVEGDTFVLVQMDDGDWYVLDVISQSNLDGGYSNVSVVSSHTSRNGHIVRMVQFTDKQGNSLGFSTLRTAISDDGAPV
jgi:hypothetical protein